MTPLRQRFIEDLQLRNRAPATIQAYVLQVRKFAQHYGRSPEHLDGEQVHRYLLYLLHEKKASWVGCDAMAALLACATAPPLRRCPTCGQGELQTIWEQPRPRGPQRKTKAPWNTS
jgi:hypothetical protein